MTVLRCLYAWLFSQPFQKDFVFPGKIAFFTLALLVLLQWFFTKIFSCRILILVSARRFLSALFKKLFWFILSLLFAGMLTLP
jgi:hypothetical protein